MGRAGSFGFTCEIETAGEPPASSLRRTLIQPDFRPRPYGTGETPLRFARHQLAMQVVRRLRAAG